MVTAIFEPDSAMANAYGLWQWDYGQILRIQGLYLPSMVEIHFSLQETGGTSVTRVGVTKDGVTDVAIPDSMLENGGIASNYSTYDIFAFIYLTDATSGQTEYKIKLQVKSRPEPEVPGGGEDPDIFHEAVRKVAEYADQAAESERQAEGWAHGREDLPERAQDNAKYYAGKTAKDAAQTAEDRKEVKRLVDSVSGIDQQVEKVEELTKQAQGAATKAGESEKASKEAQKLAESAKTAAETAASKTAEDRTAVDNAKAEVLKAKESVSSDRAAVESAKKEIDQLKDDIPTEVQDGVQKVNDARDAALGDISKTGTAHKTAVESAGTKAVETITNTQTEAVGAVNTAKTKAVEVVETAKTGAVKTVQTEGTTQTGNVTTEGEKQVQAVQAAAQEIVADREQIQTNKSDIADLRQSKAGAVTETVSGETIQVKDSAVAEFEGMRVFGKSTQDGVPTPESPVPIMNVGNEGTVNIKITGKNLIPFPYKDGFSKDTNGVKITVDDNGIITFDGTSNGSVMFTVFNEKIPLKEGKVYYISDGLNAQLNGIAGNNVAKKYTAKKGDYISQLWYWFPSGTNFVSQTFKPQFEIGDMATEFEIPRKLQVLALATPNGLPGIPVDSGGNYTDENGQQWVCDEIDLGRGKYVQRIGTEAINGGALDNGGFIGKYFKTRFALKNSNKGAPMPVKCDKFINSSEQVESCTQGYGSLYVKWDSSRFKGESTTIDDVNLFLKDNPLNVVYISGSPVERDLDPEEIEAYKTLRTNYPTTVITNDSGAGVEVGYVADTKLYIVEKIEEPLQKQITDLQNALINQKISGGGIKVTDSARLPIKGFKVFGKSTQDGVPTPESPVPIASVGSKGNIKSYVSGKNICSSYQKAQFGVGMELSYLSKLN